MTFAQDQYHLEAQGRLPEIVGGAMWTRYATQQHLKIYHQP